MRILLASLLAAGLVGCASEAPAPPPAANLAALPKLALAPPTIAPICGKPVEKVGLAMAALRMQLSITDISCGGRDKFNSFTVKYRNDIDTQNKTLGGFFTRAYGRRGVAQHDEYETSQINQMSAIGTSLGTSFCASSLPMFDEVLALKNGTDLANYAVAKNFDQVLTINECSATPAAPAKMSPAKAAPKKS